MLRWTLALLFLLMSAWQATAVSNSPLQNNAVGETIILFSRFLTGEEIIAFTADQNIAATTLYHGWRDQIGGFDIPDGVLLTEAVETAEDCSLAFVERAIEAEDRALTTELMPSEQKAHANLRDAFLARQEDVMMNGITFYAVKVRQGSVISSSLISLPAVAGIMPLQPDSREVPKPAWLSN